MGFFGESCITSLAETLSRELGQGWSWSVLNYESKAATELIKIAVAEMIPSVLN